VWPALKPRSIEDLDQKLAAWIKVTVRVVGTRHWAFMELLAIKLRAQLDAGPSPGADVVSLSQVLPTAAASAVAGVAAADTLHTQLGSMVRSAWHVLHWQQECGTTVLCDWVSDFAGYLTGVLTRVEGLMVDEGTRSLAQTVLTRCASQARVEYGTKHELERALSVALDGLSELALPGRPLSEGPARSAGPEHARCPRA
jgi:hypothetical protein